MWILRSLWLHREYSQSLSHLTNASTIFLKLINALHFCFKMMHKNRNGSVKFCDYEGPHTHTHMHMPHTCTSLYLVKDSLISSMKRKFLHIRNLCGYKPKKNQSNFNQLSFLSRSEYDHITIFKEL